MVAPRSVRLSRYLAIMPRQTWNSPCHRGFLSRPSGVDTARSSSDPHFYKMSEGAASLINQGYTPSLPPYLLCYLTNFGTLGVEFKKSLESGMCRWRKSRWRGSCLDLVSRTFLISRPIDRYLMCMLSRDSAPIVGSSKLENILDLVGAVDLILTEEEVNSHTPEVPPIDWLAMHILVDQHHQPAVCRSRWVKLSLSSVKWGRMLTQICAQPVFFLSNLGTYLILIFRQIPIDLFSFCSLLCDRCDLVKADNSADNECNTTGWQLQQLVVYVLYGFMNDPWWLLREFKHQQFSNRAPQIHDTYREVHKALRWLWSNERCLRNRAITDTKVTHFFITQFDINCFHQVDNVLELGASDDRRPGSRWFQMISHYIAKTHERDSRHIWLG